MKVILLAVAVLVTGCASVAADGPYHAPQSVQCALSAIASLDGFSVHKEKQRITFKGSGFKGEFFHGSESGATFTRSSVVVTSRLFGPDPSPIADLVHDAVNEQCAAQPGAAADGSRLRRALPSQRFALLGAAELFLYGPPHL
jgi:hypothetical protein